MFLEPIRGQFQVLWSTFLLFPKINEIRFPKYQLGRQKFRSWVFQMCLYQTFEHSYNLLTMFFYQNLFSNIDMVCHHFFLYSGREKSAQNLLLFLK